jgi:hypothetical protein
MDSAPNNTLAGIKERERVYRLFITNSCVCIARTMWALFTDSRFWTFKSNADVPPAPFKFNGVNEQMAAAVAVQASYMTENGVTAAQGAQGRQNGTFFSRYMDAATASGSKFVFITEWNEWTAINFGSLPGAKFVDLWREEYSSDIEPMHGGHGAFYYNLMTRKIKEFKGQASSSLTTDEASPHSVTQL